MMMTTAEGSTRLMIVGMSSCPRDAETPVVKMRTARQKFNTPDLTMPLLLQCFSMATMIIPSGNMIVSFHFA